MKEHSRMLKSAGSIGLLTGASRILGLIRDVLMAGLFGTSVHMSAFVVAFTIPNLFRRLFGEGALSSSLIPVFVETRNREGADRAWQTANRILLLATLFLSALILGGTALIQLILSHGDVGELGVFTLKLLRIMFPYMLFICMAALAMAICHSCKHFLIPAATPCILNLVWIGTLLFIMHSAITQPTTQITIVAAGILVAGLLQAVIQIPVLIRFGWKPRLGPARKDEKVQRILKLALPAALGLAVTQFNVLIDRLLASLIAPWAPAALYFSERLIYLPLGLFATAMGTVLLPTLSQHAAERDIDGLKESFQFSMRTLLFIMLPCAAGLLVMARPIVSALFERFAFEAASTAQTAVALQFYAPGLVVFSLLKILVPFFYSRQDTRTPVRLSLWTVALNLVLNITFIITFPAPMKHAGLALGTVLAETFYAVMLGRALHRKTGNPGWGAILRSGLRQTAAACIMCIAVLLLYHRLLAPMAGQYLPAEAATPVALSLAMVGGILTYLTAALVLNRKEVLVLFRLWR